MLFLTCFFSALVMKRSSISVCANSLLKILKFSMHVFKSEYLLLLLLLLHVSYLNANYLDIYTTNRTQKMIMRSAVTSSLFKKILAVVHYSFPASNDQIMMHCNLWNDIFPSMILFGPWSLEKLEGMRVDVHVPVMRSPYDFAGFNAQVIMLRALQYFKNDFFDGYLYLHDDILVSPKTMSLFDLKKIWFCDDVKEVTIEPWESRKHDWPWFNHEVMGIPSMEAMLIHEETIAKTMEKCAYKSNHTWYVGQSDIYYLPTKLTDSFIKTVGIFAQYKLFFEIAITTWIKCFSMEKKIEVMKLCTSWDPRLRGHVHKFGTACLKDADVIHPIKYKNNPHHVDFAKDFLKKHS